MYTSYISSIPQLWNDLPLPPIIPLSPHIELWSWYVLTLSLFLAAKKHIQAGMQRSMDAQWYPKPSCQPATAKNKLWISTAGPTRPIQGMRQEENHFAKGPAQRSSMLRPKTLDSGPHECHVQLDSESHGVLESKVAVSVICLSAFCNSWSQRSTDMLGPAQTSTKPGTSWL